MSMNDDDRAIIGGCDRTADCDAEVHASKCWRGYWLAHHPTNLCTSAYCAPRDGTHVSSCPNRAHHPSGSER